MDVKIVELKKTILENNDEDAVVERIHNFNPSSEVFFISAKTGEGVSEWTEWLCRRIDNK